MFGRLAVTALIGAAMTGAAAAEGGSPRKLSADEVLAEAKQTGLVVGPAIVEEDLDLGRRRSRGVPEHQLPRPSGGRAEGPAQCYRGFDLRR
jgi:hypothetical protein